MYFAELEVEKRDENQNFNDTKFTTAIVISRGEGLVFVKKSIQNLEKTFSAISTTPSFDRPIAFAVEWGRRILIKWKKHS